MREEHESTDRQKSLACGRCGALNSPGFDRCIRCGQPLTAITRSLDKLGGKVDATNLLASKLLIGLTVLVFAGQIYVAQLRGEGVFQALFKPSGPDAIRFGAVHLLLLPSEPWRLLSAVFVHFGAIHLIGNMFFLAWLGRLAEPAIGPSRFVLTYALSGIAGFAASMGYTYLVEAGDGATTAGASGAVFGIVGLVLGMLIRQKNPQWKRFAVQAVLFNVLLGIGVNQARVGVMVNNIAHFGGLIVGLLFGFVFAAPPRPGERAKSELWANLAAVVSLLACLASLILAQRSPTWRRPQSFSARSSEEPTPPTLPSSPQSKDFSAKG